MLTFSFATVPLINAYQDLRYISREWKNWKQWGQKRNLLKCHFSVNGPKRLPSPIQMLWSKSRLQHLKMLFHGVQPLVGELKKCFLIWLPSVCEASVRDLLFFVLRIFSRSGLWTPLIMRYTSSLLSCCNLDSDFSFHSLSVHNFNQS